MKRTPLRRHTPLRRTSAPARGAPIRKRNAKRRARLFQAQFGSRERVEWMHRTPCCACGSRERIHAHHVTSRGAGGTADDMVPLCATCHDRVHAIGQRRFEAEHGLNLRALARQYADEWNERRAA